MTKQLSPEKIKQVLDYHGFLSHIEDRKIIAIDVAYKDGRSTMYKVNLSGYTMKQLKAWLGY